MLIAAFAAGGAFFARRRGALQSVPGTDQLRGLLRRPGGRGRTGPPGHEDWTCPQCGQGYRRTGLDRHRVYWVAGADEGDPVLGGECVQCGRPLDT